MLALFRPHPLLGAEQQCILSEVFAQCCTPFTDYPPTPKAVHLPPPPPPPASHLPGSPQSEPVPAHSAPPRGCRGAGATKSRGGCGRRPRQSARPAGDWMDHADLSCGTSLDCRASTSLSSLANPPYCSRSACIAASSRPGRAPAHLGCRVERRQLRELHEVCGKQGGGAHLDERLLGLGGGSRAAEEVCELFGHGSCTFPSRRWEALNSCALDWLKRASPPPMSTAQGTMVATSKHCLPLPQHPPR